MNEKQPASFLNQIKNLSQSGKNVIQDFVNGNEIFATEELQKQRWNICNSCEWNDTEHKKCTKCGCYLEAKLKFNSSFCPILKWTDVKKVSE